MTPRDAAVVTQTRLHVLKQVSAGVDHPWSVAYPEGAYLTGLLASVDRMGAEP